MSSHRPNVSIETACACGEVRLTIGGPVKSMFMCACRDCQKATGTGHAAVAVFAAEDVTVAGETHGFARPAASRATLTRWFCPACGTPLLAQSSRAPALRMVPVGLLGAVDWFAPSQLIFARSHQEWDMIPASLPRHATYRGQS